MAAFESIAMQAVKRDKNKENSPCAFLFLVCLPVETTVGRIAFLYHRI